MTSDRKPYPLGKPELAALVERAAEERPWQAWSRLAEFLLSGADAWPRVLIELGRCSPVALEAAGNWLFMPDHPREMDLRRSLAGHWDQLMGLARRRPGPWLVPGLAWVAAGRGGRALADLAAWARQEDWGRRVVECLPPGCRLGGLEPVVWLARAALGPARSGAVTRLARSGRWEGLAVQGPEALIAARSRVGATPGAERAPALAWPAGEHAMDLLEEMARVTAREGRRAWELARGLARDTGRPVILLGNSNLGGPPLWAAPGPWQEGWPAPNAADLAAPPGDQVRELARLRARRLSGEILLHAMWDLKAATEVGGRGRAALADCLDRAAPWLDPEKLVRLRNGELGFGLDGPSQASAREAAHQALDLARRLERGASRAMGLAWGLTRLAAEAGRPLVLPWADKFVASTLRAGDYAYLAGMARLFSSIRPAPLLLLVDETPHPPPASLSEVLEVCNRLNPDLPMRGLGALGGDQPEPADLEAALRDAARGASLVAFRPMPGACPPPILERVLDGKRAGEPLCPASRDGAAFLLTGTGLADLTGAVAGQEVGGPPDWLLTTAGFSPLGAWFRRRVADLAGRAEPPAGFWRRVQTGLNLW